MRGSEGHFPSPALSQTFTLNPRQVPQLNMSPPPTLHVCFHPGGVCETGAAVQSSRPAVAAAAAG